MTALSNAPLSSGSKKPFLMADRPQKITFGEMRESGVRGVLIYCRIGTEGYQWRFVVQ
jgi:hypothetical protein